MNILPPLPPLDSRFDGNDNYKYEVMKMDVKWPLEFDVVLKESVSTPGQWEFGHPGKNSTGQQNPNYTSSLPLNIFPVTHKINKYGIIVNYNNGIKGAFHRYLKSRFGDNHFYVGSPYQQLRGDTATEWRSFVQKFGVFPGEIKKLKLKIYPDKSFIFS